MNHRHFFYLFGGCFLFAVIYSPSPLYFLSDDWDSLLFSLHPANILHSFRPLSDASLLLDYSIWKMNAVGFHVTNLTLHFATVFCFYHFSKLLFSLRNDDGVSSKPALASSLLFLFYPFHSEALFWIVARGSILCTLFGLLCFIFYIKKEKRTIYYLLSLICFVASLLSYEEAWIIPVIITIFTFVYKQQDAKKNLFYVAGFWLLFLLYLSGRFYFTQDIIGTPYGSERMMNFDIFFLCKNLAALVFRSVVPPMQSSVIFSITCVIIAAVLLTLLFAARKKLNRVFHISAVFFFLSLLPVLPLGIDTHDTESERFLYFPSLFFIIIFMQLFTFILTKKNVLFYVLIVAESIALWQSYDSFAISSNISRITMSSIIKARDTDTVFCSRLPDQYKGAFIFRNGFESMVKLVKKDSVQRVVILSTSELFHPAKTYRTDWKDSTSKEQNLYIEWQEEKVVLKK